MSAPRKSATEFAGGITEIHEEHINDSRPTSNGRRVEDVISGNRSRISATEDIPSRPIDIPPLRINIASRNEDKNSRRLSVFPGILDSGSPKQFAIFAGRLVSRITQETRVKTESVAKPGLRSSPTAVFDYCGSSNVNPSRVMVLMHEVSRPFTEALSTNCAIK